MFIIGYVQLIRSCRPLFPLAIHEPRGFGDTIDSVDRVDLRRALTRAIQHLKAHQRFFGELLQQR